MKILSDKEYERLLNDANQIRNMRDFEHMYKEAQEKISNLETQKQRTEEEHNREVKNIQEDHKILLKRKDSEVEGKVAEGLAKANKQISDLTIESNNAKKEVEILTNAFENLGFDVKDMKSILNKLVDGVVSKNQIQLLNPSK